MNISYLQGKKFCIVFAKYTGEDESKVKLRCHHGRAVIIDKEKLYLEEEKSGAQIGVPSSALNKILPSDGTDILKDSEYFVIVKVDPQIEF